MHNVHSLLNHVCHWYSVHTDCVFSFEKNLLIFKLDWLKRNDFCMKPPKIQEIWGTHSDEYGMSIVVFLDVTSCSLEGRVTNSRRKKFQTTCLGFTLHRPSRKPKWYLEPEPTAGHVKKTCLHNNSQIGYKRRVHPGNGVSRRLEAGTQTSHIPLF
jgi:hypothetical protein